MIHPSQASYQLCLNTLVATIIAVLEFVTLGLVRFQIASTKTWTEILDS
jgi:hypothetical protein